MPDAAALRHASAQFHSAKYRTGASIPAPFDRTGLPGVIRPCTRTGMTIRPIVRYPDPRLALPAQPLTVFDSALRELAGDLAQTIRAAPGIGITAPHIGVLLRVVVLDLAGGAQSYVNPVITWASPELIAHL